MTVQAKSGARRRQPRNNRTSGARGPRIRRGEPPVQEVFLPSRWSGAEMKISHLNFFHQTSHSKGVGEGTMGKPARVTPALISNGVFAYPTLHPRCRPGPPLAFSFFAVPSPLWGLLRLHIRWPDLNAEEAHFLRSSDRLIDNPGSIFWESPVDFDFWLMVNVVGRCFMVLDFYDCSWEVRSAVCSCIPEGSFVPFRCILW